MARITPKQAEEMLNAYSNVYTDLEERVQDLHERPRSQAIQNYLNRKKAEQDLNNKVDKIEKETGQDFSKGARMSNPNLTPSSSFNKNNNNNNNNNNSNNTVTSKGGVERTVTKNNDGKGVTVTKKDLDSETEDLIANTKTVKNSKFAGKEAKADLGSYKSIFDKGNNSNAKGNPIGGNNEGGPKGNPISTQSNNNQSNNNQPGSGSRQVKPGLIGRLLPNHPGNKTGNNQQQTGNNQQQTGNNQQQTGNNQQARPGRTVGAPQGSGKPGSLVRVQGNQNKPNLGDRIKSGISRLGSMAANTISRAKTSLSNQGPIQGRQTGTQRRAAQTAQRTQQTGNNQQKPGLSFKDAIKASETKAGQDLIKSNDVLSKKPVGAQVGGDGGRQAWLDKTRNSPAARGGMSDNQRWAARQKHLKFQADRKAAQAAKRGATNVKPQGTPVQKRVTSVMDMEGYDPMENLFDDTVHFLVSEGHVQNESEAISIMSTPEFISGFEKGLNESFENNK